MGDRDKTVLDWGQLAQVAPSIKRADVRGWLLSSALLGAFAAFLALAAMWRPLPLLGEPPSRLRDHAHCALDIAANKAVGIWWLEAGRCSAYYSELDAESRFAAMGRLAIASIAFFLPGALLAGAAFKGRDGLTHLRGSTRGRGAQAKRDLNIAMAKRVKRRPDHEIAPGIPYPGELWTRHVLVVGGVGSGKSTAIKPLIKKVVDADEQMLLFDPKSEFTMGFAKPEILAPWDSRSLSWDIAKDMRNLLDMRRFAASMIKDSQDPMWSNASRQLLVGLMLYLKRTRGRDWGWQELSDLIALPQDSLLSIMKRFHPEAVRAVEKASVTTAGILINLASFCSSIFDLAEAWGDAPADRRISFVEWTQGRSKFKQVILQGHGAYSELTKSYVEAVVGVVSSMVNSVEMVDDPKRKIWFIADEFGQMGKVPVRPLFEVGRSRGFRCVVACQDFAQLEEIYGQSMVKALVGMCGSLLVGQMMQGETAEALCKAFGTREVERENYSSSFGAAGNGPGRSTTLSFAREEVPLYKPSELTSRLGLNPEGTAVTLLLFTGGHAYELQWPLFDIENARAPHVPARWTLGCGPQADAPAPGDAANVRPLDEGMPIDERALADEALRELDAMAAKSGAPNEGIGVVEGARAGDAASDAGGGPNAESPVDGASRESAPDASHAAIHGQANRLGRSLDGGLDAVREGGHEEQLLGVSQEPGFGVDMETAPKQAVEVVAAPGSGGHGSRDEPKKESEHEEQPAFDALAELAAMKIGAPLLGIAIEASAACEASAAPLDAVDQTVRLAPVARRV